MSISTTRAALLEETVQTPKGKTASYVFLPKSEIATVDSSANVYVEPASPSGVASSVALVSYEDLVSLQV